MLWSEDYISMSMLSEQLYVSKTTISNTLKELKEIIKKSAGVYLEISHVKGIRIIADEEQKRALISKLIFFIHI